MIKLKEGQEVRFRSDCWAKNQLGIITDVFESGWLVNGEYTKHAYMVKLCSRENGLIANFYDFELRLSERENRNVNINQILS